MVKWSALALATAVVLAAVTSGCGAEGVAKGATVTAYVVEPLCAGAEASLKREGGRAAEVRVTVVCLPRAESSGRLDLARVGANARHATEDSTGVAFLEPPGRAGSFSHPILQSAELPWIVSGSGGAAMSRLLKAIDEAGGSGSLRSTLAEELD